jgi:hypothetical protein
MSELSAYALIHEMAVGMGRLTCARNPFSPVIPSPHVTRVSMEKKATEDREADCLPCMS